MSKRIPRGSVSPCVVTFDANHDTSEPIGLRWDPLDVTAVSINVRRPDGATDTWSASISATTTSSLTALHVLEAGDVDVAGRYDCELVLTFAGGSLKSFVDSIQVIESLT